MLIVKKKEPAQSYKVIPTNLVQLDDPIQAIRFINLSDC